MFDATSFATLQPLAGGKIPVFEMQDGKVIDTGNTQRPPVTTLPVSITAFRIAESVILDPAAEEEACMDARITITTNSQGSFTAIQKGSTGAFTVEQLKNHWGSKN